MIAYLDSWALARSYLPDELRAPEVRELIDSPSITTITGSWTRIEASGAFVRAGRAGRGDVTKLEAAFGADTAPAGGNVVVVDVNQAEIESIALSVARLYGIRAMDAWHLACARLAFEALAESGDELGFVTHDAQQAEVARAWGYTVL
ncbi:MAG: type II toxin-antitoxin system VapC family toxin [Rhodoglobus sp.]